MKQKIITAFLLLTVTVCGVFTVRWAREQRMTNLVVSCPRLYGTVIAADDSTVTLAADVWGDLYEKVYFNGDTMTFDRSSVLYPDGDKNPYDLSIGDNVALVVEGRPINAETLAFERIYMVVDYLKYMK